MESEYLIQRRKKMLGIDPPSEKKEQKPIPKVSEKRKITNREYKRLVKDILGKDGNCKIKSPVCTGKASGLHHLQKRSPKNLTKKGNLIPACSACNLFIETDPEWAKENGFTISKFKK